MEDPDSEALQASLSNHQQPNNPTTADRPTRSEVPKPAAAARRDTESQDQDLPFIYPPEPEVVKKPPRPKTSIWEDIFATRQLARKGDREVYIRYTVRELIVYLFYLIVLCLLTFGVTSTVTYDYTKVLYDLFLDEPIANLESQLSSERTFRSSIHVLDFWLFVSNVIPHYLYWENLYNSASRADAEKHFVRKRFDNESKGILYQNELLGVPRLRQLRVAVQPCPVVRNYRHLRKDECFPPYHEHYEERGNSKLGNFWVTPAAIDSNSLTYEAWRWRTEAELAGSSHWGLLATYSGGGAVQNLGSTSNKTREIIAELRRSLWIDRSTRVVFLDFTVYNSNLNLFCVVRLIWEFAPTGGMLTRWNLRTVRLLRYVEFLDFYLVLPCEILFCAFTLYYFLQECIEIHHLGLRAYLHDIWSWVDAGILLLSSLCIAFSVYRYDLVVRKLSGITRDAAKYADFEFLGYWQIQFNHVIATCVFFSWVKIFKYISFNKTMTQLSSTLSRCSKDIGGFAIMFFVCFFAFAQLGYLLFGTQLEDFSTFLDAMLALLRLILGDFNFRQLEAANRILGPIYFLAYVFFVFFVLLNMFLAIINDTYSEVKAEIQAQKNEFQMADYFRMVWNNVRGCFGKRSSQLDAENAVKLAAADGLITYDDLRKHLKSAHFSDVEVEMFLARYELDVEHALDDKEILDILDSLEDVHRDPKTLTLIRGEYKFEEEPHKEERPIPDYVVGFRALHERIVLLEASVTHFVGRLKTLKTHIEGKEDGEQEPESVL